MIFFCLMIPPPLRSTLFPYTTLFRSLDHVEANVEVSTLLPARLVLDPGVEVEVVAGRAEGKSTRQNSSHSQISYAVFCLKKKKHHTKHQASDSSANTNRVAPARSRPD